jgi:hypothetical protein
MMATTRIGDGDRAFPGSRRHPVAESFIQKNQ